MGNQKYQQQGHGKLNKRIGGQVPHDKVGNQQVVQVNGVRDFTELSYRLVHHWRHGKTRLLQVNQHKRDTDTHSRVVQEVGQHWIFREKNIYARHQQQHPCNAA